MTGDPADHDFARPFSEIWGEHIAANDAKPLPSTGRWTPSEHTRLVKATMDAMQRLPGQKRVRKRQVGRFIVTDPQGNPRKQNGKWIYVKVSIAGDPDVELSWLPPGHRVPLMFGLECKTGSGRLSEDQKEKRQSLIMLGWKFIEVRSAAQAFEDVLAAGRIT
jgi:hypothetical protein